MKVGDIVRVMGRRGMRHGKTGFIIDKRFEGGHYTMWWSWLVMVSGNSKWRPERDLEVINGK